MRYAGRDGVRFIDEAALVRLLLSVDPNDSDAVTSGRLATADREQKAAQVCGAAAEHVRAIKSLEKMQRLAARTRELPDQEALRHAERFVAESRAALMAAVEQAGDGA